MYALVTPLEQTMVIKRVAPVSCAKVAGALYAALGLILAAIVAVFALVNGRTANASGVAHECGCRADLFR